MEDKIIMEFLASEFQAGTKLMNQLIETVVPEDEEN